MKEFRKFVYNPRFNPIVNKDNTVTKSRSICLTPYKDGDKYNIAIGVEEYIYGNDYNFSRGDTLQKVQIIGNHHSKLYITIKGIVNGEITGQTSELLMMDVFIQMILSKHPEWIKEQFPDWDYISEFKLDQKIDDELDSPKIIQKNAVFTIIPGGLA